MNSRKKGSKTLHRILQQTERANSKKPSATQMLPLAREGCPIWVLRYTLISEKT